MEGERIDEGREGWMEGGREGAVVHVDYMYLKYNMYIILLQLNP